MGQAALAFLGVLLGAAIAGGVSLWQVQLITAREREARQTLREQERADRRDAFQRETILALQDALVDLIRAVSREQERMLLEAVRSGEGPIRTVGRMAPEFHEARWIISKLKARIFDPELRDLANRLQNVAVEIISAQTRQALSKWTDRANELLASVHNRVTALLPDLF
jgi:hypothetical protein